MDKSVVMRGRVMWDVDLLEGNVKVEWSVEWNGVECGVEWSGVGVG